MRLSSASWRSMRWGLLGIGSSSANIHDKPIETIQKMNRYEHPEELDGWTRLSFLLKRDSPEMSDISESTTVAYITGFAIGGFKTSRDAYQRFVLEHKHEMFRHPRDAQSKLRERIFLGLFKGGIKYGLHIAVLTFTFTFACSIFLVYRNYRNPLDNALCGSILGAMYTLLRGPKAAISGGVIGGLLGLFCGLVSLAAEAIAGESSQDRWRRLYHIMQEEEEKETAMAKKIQMNASWAESEPEEESDWDRNVRFVIHKLKAVFHSDD